MQIIILIIALISIGANVYAARQGTIGQKSTGSVNISVTIPSKVKLFVDGSLQQPESGMCLRIHDANTRSGFHQYQIRVWDAESLSDRTEQITINNMYGVSTDTQKACGDYETSFLENINNTNTNVLMFVPE